VINCYVFNIDELCIHIFHFQTQQNIISEEYIHESIYLKIEELHIHPYGLTKDLIKSALDALCKIEIIKKIKK
jgi:hypothetical protein